MDTPNDSDFPQVTLYPVGGNGATRPKSITIVLWRESETDFYGQPIDNAHCPCLQFPKFAWVGSRRER